MRDIICSFAYRGDVWSVAILENGQIVSKMTKKMEDTHNSYRNIIYVFTQTLRYIRQYIQSEGDDFNVCFETSNRIFVQWLKDRYPREEYAEDFMEALNLLQELAIRYSFSYAKVPKALKLLEQPQEVAVSGLNLDEYEE